MTSSVDVHAAIVALPGDERTTVRRRAYTGQATDVHRTGDDGGMQMQERAEERHGPGRRFAAGSLCRPFFGRYGRRLYFCGRFGAALPVTKFPWPPLSTGSIEVVEPSQCPFPLSRTAIMYVLPNCKINLGLYIVSRRPDGYHNLETAFYPVPLKDSLTIETASEESFTMAGIPVDGEARDNLVMRVYRSLKTEFGLPPLSVHLYKKIPLGAGLGGGSSDAAHMMMALNELFDLRLSTDDMERRLSTFGADCPFFVRNCPVLATGIGNEFAPLELSLKGKHVVLVKPDVFVSTREAYAGVTPCQPATPLARSLMQPIETWKTTVANDFERSVFKAHPELAAIKQTLYDMGALYAAMSGSGSTLFGLFDRPVDEAAKVFKDSFVFTSQLLK